MRDLQHWKDKVELSLDGRQVFFLFFGGAVLACLLFATGVMTGRRLEARAIALETPSAEDPLAALDQLGDLEDEELTYHRTLTHDGKSSARAHDVVASPSDPIAAKPVAAKPSAAQAPKPVTPPASHAPAAKPAVPSAKPASAALSEPVDEVASEPSVAIPAPKPVAATPAVVVAAVKPVAVTKPAALIGGAAKGEGKEPTSDVTAAHFTLQLSAFAARRDADDFMHRVQVAGYKAFVVSSDLPGKGIMYRVRVGDYASKDAALAEKGAVEKKLKVSAYLAKL